MKASKYAVILSLNNKNKDLYYKLQVGDSLKLELDDGNEHDPLAVKTTFEGEDCGYLCTNTLADLPGICGAHEYRDFLDENPSIRYCTITLEEENDYETKSGKELRRFIGNLNVIEKKAPKKKKAACLLQIKALTRHTGAVNLLSRFQKGENPKVRISSENIDPDIAMYMVYESGKEEKAGEVLPESSGYDAIRAYFTGNDENRNLEGAITKILTPTDKNGNQMPGTYYEVSVEIPEEKSLSHYEKMMEEIISNGLWDKEGVEEGIKYMLSQKVPEKLIEATLKNRGKNWKKVPKPKILYQTPKKEVFKRQEIEYVAPLDAMLSYLQTGTHVRLFGAASAGKDILIDTACWLAGVRYYRIEGHNKADVDELLYALRVQDGDTVVQIQDGLKLIVDERAVLIIDEANAIMQSVMTSLHSLADSHRSLYVEGYGMITINPKSCIMLTMNTDVDFADEMNQPTVTRFQGLELPVEYSVERFLPKGTDQEIIRKTQEIIDLIKRDYPEVEIAPRGLIEGFKNIEFLGLKSVLITGIANQQQDREIRHAISDIITAKLG